MSITKLNKSTPKFIFKETENFKYKTLEELYKEYGKDTTHLVTGAYINTGRFGQEGLLVTDKEFVNLPKHMTEDVETIRSDDDIIDDINLKTVGFTIYEYTQKKFNKICYGLNWVDIEK